MKADKKILLEKWNSIIEYDNECNHPLYKENKYLLAILLEKIEKFVYLYKGLDKHKLGYYFINIKNGMMGNQDIDKLIAINYFDRLDKRLFDVKWKGVSSDLDDWWKE